MKHTHFWPGSIFATANAQSLAETELILKIRPNDPDVQSNIPFLKAASTFPGQKVLSGSAANERGWRGSRWEGSLG